MIVEHARVTVRPGHEAAFEKAVAEAAATVLPRAEGFRGIVLHRCIEDGGQYVCVLEWDTLEAHTVDFREGPLFEQWRGLVGPHFAEAPQVRHFHVVPPAG